ncbi:BgTH12-02581 [Blumeria graminis f. sp. triticale]|uniref:BgTH12-02581 n=1 Tax=Blumeria graminis f. sp. triticale TaxID=1689686 RepID=A0A9W4D6P0_BLUGR|nr:BgTH12-02581 [Blumeria graminis f. sp. triticale]
MTEFTDICEYLARNPLANILALFLDIYEDSGSKPAYAALFFSLAPYAFVVKDKDASSQLFKQLNSIATKINENVIDVIRLQPLFHAISEKENEKDILNIALDFARNPPYRIGLIQRSCRPTSTPSLSKETILRGNDELFSYQTTAPIVEKALQNELDGNVITGLNNFWEIFFLDQDWSDQTLRIWECYQRYEIDEIEERERDDGGNPLIAQTKYLSRESNPKETLKLTHRQKNPKMFTGLETLEEGIPLGTSGGSQRQETNKEVHCPELTEGNKIVEMKLTYKNKILIENMTEKEIWDWLIFFQDNFLNQLINPNSNSLRLFPSLVIEDKGSQIRNKYCHTSHNYQIKGTTNNYQVDFLVKSIDVPSNEIHQWKDVRVLGEFTIKPFKDERRNKFLQLSRSVLQIFSTQPLRQFVHGFCLFKNDFELWLFNRSGAYSSGPLSIKDNKDKLVRAISSYLFMSDEELGIYSPFRNVNGRSFLSFSTEKDDQAQDYDINPNPIFKAGTLVSRGTVCYEMSEESAIVKYSWTRTAGKSEIDFMQDACDTEGVVNYLRADRICKTSDHLQGLNFGSAAYSDISGLKPIATGKGEKQPTTPPRIKDRELTRLIVTPRGFRLNSSRTILEFVEGIRDAIMAHQRLFVEKKVLHGDISDGNIILAFVGGRFRGLLIDFDHAVKVEDTSDKHENSYLTGTLKYMALERLEYAAKTENSITRTYYHDLESFFYVFLTGCIEYERRENPKVVVNLQSWCEENIKENFKGKRSDMTYFETDILPKFSNNFDDLKELARKLHKILFGDGQVNFGTPIEYEPVYRDMIGAFDEVIALIRGGIILNKALEQNKIY